MPGETCACPHMCKILSTNEISSMPTVLSTVKLHMPHRNFVIATTTLVTIIFSFHNSALSCYILSETLDMFQEIFYFGFTNLGSQVQFQLIKKNHSCRQGRTCKSTLLHRFHPGMDWVYIRNCSVQSKVLASQKSQLKASNENIYNS